MFSAQLWRGLGLWLILEHSNIHLDETELVEKENIMLGIIFIPVHLFRLLSYF